MKAFFKFIFSVLLLVILAVAALLFGARFNDGVLTMEGPLGMVAGGPFSSGEVTPRPADWNFLQERQFVEFQTLTPARSRTVWLAVNEGRLFIFSSYMLERPFNLWKRWPHDVAEDDRIILRADGNLYEQRLQRIDGGPLAVAVLNEYDRKYNIGPQTDDSLLTTGSVWMYEVLDR